MKNIKRILALVIVATMFVAIAIIPVSAAEPRRAPKCGNCGGNTYLWIREPADDNGYVQYGTQNCVHFTYGYDSLQRMKYINWYKCEDCGDPHNYAYTYSYKTVCHGHA